MGASRGRAAIYAAFASLQKQEQFELHAWCAIHDKPWVIRFRKGAEGLYHSIECVRTQALRKGHVENGGLSEVSLALDRFGELDHKCPWCGDLNLNRCECGWVCGGREKGDLFICRDSCGERWVGVPVTELDGMGRSRKHVPLSAPSAFGAPRDARPVRSVALLPARTALLLGDGSGSRHKR